MMIYLRTTSLIFLLSFSLMVFSNPSTKDEYHTLCGIFQEAVELNISDIQLRSDYITDQIDKRIQATVIIDAVHALFNVDPSERYGILKAGAEHHLKESWNCPSAQKLLQ